MDYMIRIGCRSVFINGSLRLRGESVARGGIRIDSSESGGVASVKNVSVDGIRNSDDAYTAQCSGIEVFYGFQNVEVTGCEVNGVENVGVNDTVSVSGIAVSGYRGSCMVDRCKVSSIRNNQGRDADGIKVFGFGQVDPPLYRGQLACVSNSQLIDCEGRGIKIQTSRAFVEGCEVIQENVRTIQQGVGVAFQWGNGTIKRCKFVYASGMAGESYSAINFQQVVTDRPVQTSQASDIQIETVDPLPRVILYQQGPTDTQLTIDGLLGYSHGPLVSRALIECPAFQSRVGKKTYIDVSRCTLGLDCPIVGYTGFESGDLSNHLMVSIRDVQNTRDAANQARPFSNISGNAVLQYRRRFDGLSSINSVLAANATIDFNKLSPGVFGVLVGGSGVTLVNGPQLASGMYVVEVLMNWFPSRLNVVRVISEHGQEWRRVGTGSWAQVVSP
jgi:hypothetical protein